MQVQAMKLCLRVITLFYALAITLNTAQNAPDFAVYWRTASFFWQGLPVYSIARDGIMPFKYPPWILPIFLPFGLLPLSIAKISWGILEASAFVYIIRWLQSRVRSSLLILSLIAFSGLWTVHAFDGQVSLILLAVGLAFFGKFGKNPLVLIYALSIKILTLFPIIGVLDISVQRGELKNVSVPRTILRWTGMAAVVLGLLSIPALKSHHYDLGEFLRQYRAVTSPGVDSSGSPRVTVRGDQAQGFVSMIFRVCDLDYRNSVLILVFSMVLALVLAAFWHCRASRLSMDFQWAGWLALTATLQPLAGFHTFVLAFPLAAMTLERTFAEKAKLRTGLCFFAILMITAFGQKTLGHAGLVLQQLSVKSWGVLFCAFLATIPGDVEKKSQRPFCL